jgi:hypothetical protein
MEKIHNVQEIEFLDDEMLLKVDGKELSFQLVDISRRLSKASRLERETFRISPSGYGIHWPLIDEDLSIAGLLKTAMVSRRTG